MELSYFKAIVDSLDSVKKSGLYATGGKCSLPLPSLLINSAPDIILGLPLGKFQAKLIIDSCTVATSVRHTWQLCPTEFSIRNSEWEEQLKTLVNTVGEKLGSDLDITCEVDKLLLCKSGAAFKVSAVSAFFTPIHLHEAPSVITRMYHRRSVQFCIRTLSTK
jgi:hypothetical protein